MDGRRVPGAGAPDLDFAENFIKIGVSGEGEPLYLPGFLDSIEAGESLLVGEADTQNKSGTVKIISGWADAPRPLPRPVLLQRSARLGALSACPGASSVRWLFNHPCWLFNHPVRGGGVAPCGGGAAPCGGRAAGGGTDPARRGYATGTGGEGAVGDEGCPPWGAGGAKRIKRDFPLFFDDFSRLIKAKRVLCTIL
jgi:hypothetical protein